MPLAYIRGKFKSKAVIIKILIDSGNLCSDLISEKLAKQLDLHINETEKRTVGTAAKDGKIQILGRAKPMLIYLEGLKYPVIIDPLIVRDLAHPMNLGQHFLRRNQANIQFNPEYIRLGLNNQCVNLQPTSFNLNSTNYRHKIQVNIRCLQIRGK